MSRRDNWEKRMTDLLISLLGGIALISAGFLLVHRFSRLSGKATALLLGLLVAAIYVPLSILSWPGADVFAIHIAIYLVTVYVLGIISSQREAAAAEGRRGFHWAPALIIAFFVVVIAVDSVFIMLAQRGVDARVTEWLFPRPRAGGKVSSHFPGTVSRDYREKDADFNTQLERLAEQEARQWQVRKGWVGRAVSGQPAVFRLQVRDRHDRPVRADQVTGKFMRPGNIEQDIAFEMQPVGEGDYAVRLIMPEPGRWNLFLRIRQGKVLHEVSAYTTVDPAGS
jgi:nitrogen fixation protein FixH